MSTRGASRPHKTRAHTSRIGTKTPIIGFATTSIFGSRRMERSLASVPALQHLQQVPSGTAFILDTISLSSLVHSYRLLQRISEDTSAHSSWVLMARHQRPTNATTTS